MKGGVDVVGVARVATGVNTDLPTPPLLAIFTKTLLLDECRVELLVLDVVVVPVVEDIREAAEALLVGNP